MTYPAQTHASAIQPSITILDIGRRLGASLKRQNELEEKERAAHREQNHSAAIYLEREMMDSIDESAALRDAIAITRAHSLEECSIQIAEAITRTSSIDVCVDGEETEADRFAAKRDLRALERLLYSVLMHIESVADRKLDDTVAPDFTYPNLNPWVAAEVHLEYIARKDASCL